MALTVIPYLAELHRPHEGHPHDGGLGRAVVGLAEVAPQAGRRGDVHDPAVAGLLHEWRGVASSVEGPLLVDGHHGVVVGLVHLDQGPVADDAGVVDEDVDGAEGVHGGGDDSTGAVEVIDPVSIGHGRTSPCLDLLDHLIGGILGRALTAERHPDVVDDDPGALVGQAQGDGPTDAATRSGHDGDSSLEQTHRATVREPRRSRQRTGREDGSGIATLSGIAPHEQRPQSDRRAVASRRSAGAATPPVTGGCHPMSCPHPSGTALSVIRP